MIIIIIIIMPNDSNYAHIEHEVKFILRAACNTVVVFMVFVNFVRVEINAMNMKTHRPTTAAHTVSLAHSVYIGL